MKKRKLFLGLSSLFVVGAFALAACTGGGETGNSTGGDDSTSEVIIETDTDDIVDDVEMEDGEVVFVGETLNVWTIVGDPDLSGLQRLVQKFNQEYRGEIEITLRNIGHYDFYNTLEDTWSYDTDSFPDLIMMHNEKTAQYAYQGMLRQVDSILEHETWSDYFSLDLSSVYENIDSSQFYGGHRYGVPIDAHGYVMHIRQDIIKKNELGFDNNTRFVPETRAEFQSLLEALRLRADAGTLQVRNINIGTDHSWYTVSGSSFYPEFTQSTDPDGLGAIYSNGGSLATADGRTITFHENEGFQTYLTDIVDRYNNRLMGEAGTNTEAFAQGLTVFFPEGPWWTSQNYDPLLNNSELSTVGNGVTAEEAEDPIYSQPMTATNTAGFWTLEENIGTEYGDKWYGNGHAFSISKTVTSLTKIYAALEFAKWYIQGIDEDEGTYNMVDWVTYGHIPAYQNVYESEGYQAALAEDLTLQALGDPADIIAMEPLPMEVTIFDAVANCVSNVTTGLRGGTVSTADDALRVMNETVASAQTMLDLLFLYAS